MTCYLNNGNRRHDCTEFHQKKERKKTGGKKLRSSENEPNLTDQELTAQSLVILQKKKTTQ
jgi:hypothetical protein